MPGEKMETLIFALIASYNAHRQQKRVVAEPEEFQPFDLLALRNSANAEPAGQRHTSLGSDERSIPRNNSPASSLRPLVLDRNIMNPSLVRTDSADSVGALSGRRLSKNRIDCVA